MNEVILIFQEIPENIKIYRLQVYDDELAKLQSWHGHYINTVDTEHLDADWLSKFLDDHEEAIVYQDKDAKCSIVLNNVGSKQYLIVTGFIL